MAELASLLEIYPDATGAARRGVRAKIKSIKSEYASLSEFREVWSACINKMSWKDQPQMMEWLNKRVTGYQEEYEKQLRKCEYELNVIDNFDKGIRIKDIKISGITDGQIERAKEFPIVSLLEVRRGNALCIFHDDKHPSLHVYKDNHAHCFACGKSADSIDIYMKMYGCDFKTAVQQLAV